MHVRVLIDVGDYERFVVAKFFAPAAKPSSADRRRRRASRTQVRRFVYAAVEKAIKDHAIDLPARSRAVARRLSEGRQPVESLPPPTEEQRRLVW